MKIGIFVGSFNPVHEGHIHIINKVLHKKIVDKVIIIPTLSYWNKNNLINIKHRQNMLKFYENENIKVDIEYSNLKYTYQILNKLNKKYNDLSLIIGADNVIKFNEWKNYKEILNYKLIIACRNNININLYIDKHNIKKYSIVNISDNISSTMVRNYLKNKEYNMLQKLLDDNVLNYIIKNKLYEV